METSNLEDMVPEPDVPAGHGIGRKGSKCALVRPSRRSSVITGTTTLPDLSRASLRGSGRGRRHCRSTNDRLGGRSLREITCKIRRRSCATMYLLACVAVIVLGLPSCGWSSDVKAAEGPKARPLSGKADSTGEKYRWLFGAQPETPGGESAHHPRLKAVDREIKNARRIYFSADSTEALNAYRKAITSLEALLDETPPGHPLLSEISRRLPVFEEMASKILGPVNMDPPKDAASSAFEILERRRAFRLSVVVKQCGPVRFHEPASGLLDEETRLLDEITRQVGPADNGPSDAGNQQRARLAKVRQALLKNSPSFATLRGQSPASLDFLRNELLAEDEVLVDFNLFQERMGKSRMVVGVISMQDAGFYQFEVNRSDIEKSIMLLQDRLREFTAGGKSTFMGHAWKEPCRRVYRLLLSRLTRLPLDKKKILVIPDGSLWYLPFTLLLDAEDRPLGTERVVSLIPSAGILKSLRSSGPPRESTQKADLLMFESVPRGGAAQSEKTPERDDKILQKATPAAVRIQKLFHNSEVWVGPAATVDRFRQAGSRKRDVTVLALPAKVTDEVQGAVQPCLFFSPAKRGPRRLLASELFETRLDSGLTILPGAWAEFKDKETPSAEGPLLLSVALFYSGTRFAMVNYAQVNWGEPEPFLDTALKKAAERGSVAEALAQYPKTMPAGVDSSFSGQPPAWAGWVFLGDPGR
ncbi:MAG: CHAT domain-containing protein [Thermodesulfobacteriota bacterium]